MERFNSYGFFANHFLVLPDLEYVHKMRNYDFSGKTDAVSLFNNFFSENKNESDKALLEKINIERTFLIRGLTKTGPKPPYESVYKSSSQGSVILELNKFYNQAGFAVSENIHEPSDYIGIELGFMQELCRQAESNPEYVQLQKDFYNKHLGKWGKQFTDEILQYARMDFYRGMGTLMAEFLDEESELLSTCCC